LRRWPTFSRRRTWARPERTIRELRALGEKNGIEYDDD
jgi:hypothetical protein